MLKDPMDVARAVVIAIFLSYVFSLASARAGVPPKVQLAQVVSGCSDSDNGRNHFTYGTVTSGGKTYNDSCYTSTWLYENYCNSGYRQAEYVQCPKGCSSGACIGTCYVGLTINEKKTGTASNGNPILNFSLLEATTTSQDASALVRPYYAEEPSDYALKLYDGYNNLLSSHELYTGRYIIAESFSATGIQGDIIELPSATTEAFFPLNSQTRATRSVKIFIGTSTTPTATIPLDASRLVCSVGS